MTACSSEQIAQAVRLPRREQCDARAIIGESELDVHSTWRGDRTERGCHVGSIQEPSGQIEFDTLEEDACLTVAVLLGVQDVPADGEHEMRHGVHQSRLIPAGDQQHDGVDARSAQCERLVTLRTTRIVISTATPPITALPCGVCALTLTHFLASSASRLGLVRTTSWSMDTASDVRASSISRWISSALRSAATLHTPFAAPPGPAEQSLVPPRRAALDRYGGRHDPSFAR
jgi:hypothetical protein